jgi:hypothetical protein
MSCAFVVWLCVMEVGVGTTFRLYEVHAKFTRDG